MRAALGRGHDVTLFNRGRTNPGLFGELETIIGDRNTPEIGKLEGRRWDAVIDTSAYFPRSVDMAMDALQGNVRQYVLISTISVYASWSIPDQDESGSVRRIADPTIEEFRRPATYGALEALCEEAASERMPGRVTNIRPGFIVGPGDETDRFTYWPARIAQGARCSLRVPAATMCNSSTRGTSANGSSVASRRTSCSSARQGPSATGCRCGRYRRRYGTPIRGSRACRCRGSGRCDPAFRRSGKRRFWPPGTAKLGH